jgi:hypothetical protein
MPKPTKFTVLSLALLLALVMAAVLPISALAQDEVPPVPAAEEIPPVEDESAPVEESAAVEEPAPAEETTPAEEPAAEEESAPAEEESLTVPEILEALPEGTDLVVLDEGGDALPLATEEAAEVIAAADPFFYDIGGIKWSFMVTCGETPNCTETKAPIQTAVEAFVSKSGVGNIYVESGTYTEDIEINNSGGEYASLTGLIGLDTGGGAPVINGTLGFYSLNAFTFQGFTINGQAEFYNGSGALDIKDITQSGGDDIGIGIHHQDGDVNLENVSAIGNNIYGIAVESYGKVTLNDVNASDNGIGAAIYGENDVTVTNSVFNSNDDGLETEGLYIGTPGNITLNNVTASGNNGYGVFIDNSDSIGNTLVENSFFKGNTLVGLYVLNKKSHVINGTVKNSQFIENGMGIEVAGNYALTNECNTFSGNGERVVLQDGATQTELGCKQENPIIQNPVFLPSEEGGERGFEAQNNLVPPLSVSDIVVETAPSTAGDLPESLPAGKTFVAGASLTLMQNGEEIESAPGGVQAFFEIPAGMEPPFVVLFWNGSEWVEIPSQVVGGKVVFTVTKPGVYVLVGG